MTRMTRMPRGPYLGRGLIGIVAIVALGVALAETDVTRDAGGVESATMHAGRLEAISFLGSYEHRVVTDAFRGGEVTAFLGRVEVDLRDAEMEGETAVLEIRTLLGRTEVRVPEHWTVAPDLGPGLGGSSSIRVSGPEADPGAPVLILRGPMVFGSVEVGN